MSNAYDLLRSSARDLIAATGIAPAASIQLAEPKQRELADLAFAVFPIAKELGQPAPDVAARIADAIETSGTLFRSVEAAGGFVNFKVDTGALATQLYSDIAAAPDAFGHDASLGAGQTIIVEYSSPNIAKKLHVGSLRTTVIGHSLYKIHKALGYNVIGDNHLGDWGTQFGYLLAAIEDSPTPPWEDAEPVAAMMKMYAEFYQASEEDPDKKTRARAWFRKLEEGDVWARSIWQKLVDISMTEFDTIYKRLGISFDTTLGESWFEPMLGPLVDDAIAKGVATIEESGAVSVHFDDKYPSCLLRKTDGATLYQTRDAATCIHRWNTYAPTRNVYVVGAEQRLHFQQVFEFVRRMGYTEIADCSVHVKFGMVTGANGERFKTRKGNVIFADEILDEAVRRATEKIMEQVETGRSEVSQPDDIQRVAETIGLGAVIYFDLHQGPERNIAFDWEKILAFDGNTGVYLQYMYARCCNIVRKAGGVPENVDSSVLTTDDERALVVQLSRITGAVRDAGARYAPSAIANWTFELAKDFARFYDRCPVLGADDPAVRDARVKLCDAVAIGIKSGLSLLGISAPDRM
jgi:arginyl-tRNA synthetase